MKRNLFTTNIEVLADGNLKIYLDENDLYDLRERVKVYHGLHEYNQIWFDLLLNTVYEWNIVGGEGLFYLYVFDESKRLCWEYKMSAFITPPATLLLEQGFLILSASKVDDFFGSPLS